MPSKLFARSFSISESSSSVCTPLVNTLIFGFSGSTAFLMSVSAPRKLLFQEMKTSFALSFENNSRCVTSNRVKRKNWSLESEIFSKVLFDSYTVS